MIYVQRMLQLAGDVEEDIEEDSPSYTKYICCARVTNGGSNLGVSAS